MIWINECNEKLITIYNISKYLRNGKDYSAYENIYGAENGKFLIKQYAWIQVLQLHSILTQNSKQGRIFMNSEA